MSITNNCPFGPMQESDDEDPEFLIAPVFKISEDIEFKEIPTNGEEYLLKVITERKNCPQVTKCDTGLIKLKKQQTYFVTEPPRTICAPEKLKPTIEWQNIQVADFSDVRMYISRLRSKHKYKVLLHLGFDIKNINKTKKFFETNEPNLSLVLRFHPVILDQGIEKITEILDEVPPGDSINHKMGSWIYALMACMKQPLLSDTTSLLRNLARKCGEIRSRLNPEDENAKNAVAPLNIFICLVSRYFRQSDLAD